MTAPAQLSTTSEGLWLTAALAGVSRLPATLRVRPIGDVEQALTAHPGLEVLEQAGICSGRTLDSDVEKWILGLGRCDIEVTISVNRPDVRAGALVGPPPAFDAPPKWLGDEPLSEEDALEAVQALRRWRESRPAERCAALCRRDGEWFAAVRVWQDGEEPVDEVVVSPLGDAAIGAVVNDILGEEPPVDCPAINIESAVLERIISGWQAQPESVDIIKELIGAGLSARQAQVVAAAADAGAVRATIGATQHTIDGPRFAVAAATVVDTFLGRMVIASPPAEPDASDASGWTVVSPGTQSRVVRAVSDVLAALPAGEQWAAHQRIQPFPTS